MSKQPKFRLSSLGCLTVAAIVGFVLGLNAGGKVLPVELNWLFAVLFAAFFGVLAFVFTGMSLRRDRGLVSETFLAIPARYASSLKTAIETANPPAQLDAGQIAHLDADLTELGELTGLLQRQPRAGAQPEIKTRLEELAVTWLDNDQLQAWLASTEVSN